jgi:hypothetical protein
MILQNCLKTQLLGLYFSKDLYLELLRYFLFLTKKRKQYRNKAFKDTRIKLLDGSIKKIYLYP